MNHAKIRKQIKKLLDDAAFYENIMYFKKANKLRERAFFLSQALEESSKDY
tara:strand:+ start:43 stop:195 length:153 start_codon:yes stop_codon:yes gene_type:complete